MQLPPQPTTTTPSRQTPEDIHRTQWKAGVLGAVNFMALILAARLIVLVGVVGGIVLTWNALGNPDQMRLWILLVYAGAVVCPTVWLAGR